MGTRAAKKNRKLLLKMKYQLATDLKGYLIDLPLKARIRVALCIIFRRQGW